MGNRNAVDNGLISELSSPSGKPIIKAAQPFAKTLRILGQSPHDSLRKIRFNTSRQNVENEVPEKEEMHDESLGTSENVSLEEKVLTKHFR